MTTKNETDVPVKKEKPKSRPQRWAASVTAAQGALDDVRTSSERLTTALEELKDLQSEYQDWRDNLPENLQSGSIAEKLDEICGLDFDSHTDTVDNALSEVESVVSDAENAELPQGFGRD